MKEQNKRQAQISKQWKAIAAQYPQVIDDLNSYVDDLRKQYVKWAEEQAIYDTPIDDHRIAGLLQQSRGCDIVRSYIMNRIDSDVVPPKTK